MAVLQKPEYINASRSEDPELCVRERGASRVPIISVIICGGDGLVFELIREGVGI